MKTAIISYDLKNVKSDDNEKVKKALTEYANTHASVQTLDVFSPFPRWVNLRFPDTTVLVTIANDTVTAAAIAGEVAGIILGQGAEIGKIYVGFLDLADDFLVNY